MLGIDSNVEMFSTCPPWRGESRGEYLSRVVDIARWCDEAGYRGILVYTDNSLIDPWLVSQVILEHTETLCPLVAVQPVYLHPYAAAKMVASLAFLHGRRIYLNMVAGGFRRDLIALGDETPHDERYDRLVEHTLIVKRLLTEDEPVTFDGRYYRVKNLRMTPPVPDELLPGITVSGSSDAGLAAARAVGATAIKYPKPPGEENGRAGVRSGVRVGVIARGSAGEAWTVAHERFPDDRTGQITHALAMQVSDSRWHRHLSELAETQLSDANPYWLGPFQNYKTFCPYLVGSYEQVGADLARYMALGFRTFILDIPPSEEELHHTALAFSAASAALRDAPLPTH